MCGCDCWWWPDWLVAGRHLHTSQCTSCSSPVPVWSHLTTNQHQDGQHLHREGQLLLLPHHRCQRLPPVQPGAPTGRADLWMFLRALPLPGGLYRWPLCCRWETVRTVRTVRIVRRSQRVGQTFLLPADCLLIWSLNRRTQEGKFLCDFSSQKVWIFIWQVSNILAVIGLLVALGESHILIRSPPPGWFDCPQVGISPVWACGRCSTLQSTSRCSWSSVSSCPPSSTLLTSFRRSIWSWARPTLMWVWPPPLLSIMRSVATETECLVHVIAWEREGLLRWRHGGGTIRLQKNFSLESGVVT